MVLQEAKKNWNPNTVLIPHGVEFKHFNQAVTADLPCPTDLQNIPSPRLGFFGLIRDWVDIGLLAQIARKRKDWHFVIIGDADSTVDLSRYRTLANIHFLGRKPYTELPAYCRHFDVGLIPFKVNDLTYAVNPIKLREYLSAGLPVVSTPMPEVKLYESLVEIAGSPAEFEQAIENSLQTTPAERTARLNAMAKETWQVKLEKINEALI